MSTPLPDPSLAASFEALLERLQRECGITFPRERRPDMERATRLAMARSDEADLGRYVASVVGGTRSLDDVIDELTVRETYFFREPEQFAFLREVVVPELLARRRGAPLRCWSAGCASGEETYSLAILLEELGVGANGRIVGTDVAAAAVAEARAARYRPWSLRGEGAVRARPYLEPRGDRWVLTSRIRRRVVFSRLNLVEDPCPPAELGPGPGCCDLVLCRNVLVYFSPPALARAVAKLYDSLAEGGWLIAASSDPPLGGLAPFFCVPTPRGTFYRKLTERPGIREPSPVPASPPRPPPPPPSVKPTFVPRPEPAPVAVVTASAAPVAEATPPSARALYEEAVALIDARRDEEAIAILRRALYLDGSFVIAHLALGLALARTQQRAAASRSFRTVLRLCERLAPRASLPFAGGLAVAAVAAIARDRLRTAMPERKPS